MNRTFVFRTITGKCWGMSDNSWDAMVQAMGQERANKFTDRTKMSDWRTLNNWQKRATFYARNGEEVADITIQ